MKIVLFPGSFKPPHQGHLKVVESIIKKYNPDLFYIIISKKPRIIEKPFNKKLNEFSSEELEILAKKYNIASDKKSIEKAVEDGIIPSISPRVSFEFWNKYLEKFPEKIRDKIKLNVAFLPSPILTAFTIAKSKKMDKNDEIFLVKSEKDQNNKRFSMFDDLGVKTKEIIIPTFKDFNSWQIRKAIYNKKPIGKFLPELDSKNKKELLSLL